MRVFVQSVRLPRAPTSAYSRERQSQTPHHGLGAYLFGGIFVLHFMLQPPGISPNLLSMLPYPSTLLVLLIYGLSKSGQRRMSAPATLGRTTRQ